MPSRQTLSFEVWVEERKLQNRKKITYIGLEHLVRGISRGSIDGEITLNGRTYRHWADCHRELTDIKPEKERDLSTNINEARMDYGRDILVIRVGANLATFYGVDQKTSKEV